MSTACGAASLIAAVVLASAAACSNTESHDAGSPVPSSPAAILPHAPATASALPPPPDVAAAPADAIRTPSGLASKVLTPGKGKVHPGPDDRVKADYTGWTPDGHMVDSSVVHGAPITFPLTAVIPGWTEGLQLMVVGEKRRLWIPSALAYGAHPRPGAPGGDLVFDVELLDILPPPKASAPPPVLPPVPEDVKAPPASATKTASGLAYRVLTPGTGSGRPTPTSTVKVVYTGWTPDGQMFDSSLLHGGSASFEVGGVIKGWTEGVQLMTKGEKARFWVPSALAYGDAPTGGQPAGMLVFDIELLDIQ
jgi:peptidylprolyl isomerase